MRRLPGNDQPADRRLRYALVGAAVVMAVVGTSSLTSASAAPIPAGTSAPVLTLTAAAPAVTAYSGTLPNGTTWKAEIPATWNGTLLLYSHGYLPTFAGVPNEPRNAPDPQTAAALLAAGYGLTGSSYAAAGWALNTAPRDQLDTLTATIDAIGRRPHRVLAVGTSMGGLVTAKLAETARGRIHGALATCGIVAGGAALGNYQLDGEFAIARLLAADPNLKLAGYANLGEAFATTSALIAAVNQAQTTARGRARVALVAALYHAPSWLPGQPPPPAGDADAVQRGQYQWLLQTLQFTTPARFDIETAMGGNPAWNNGVNYRRLLDRSADRDTVRALYRAAGLDLRADLDGLTRAAAGTADPGAVRRIFATSVPFGRLEMPTLSIHTTADQLVPVQQESAYRNAVERAGRSGLLRQAYVARPGHCTFTPAELVAAVRALDHRVATGRWDGLTTAEALQRAALRLGLGDAAYVRFQPGNLLRESFSGNDGTPFARPEKRS
jgi:pimeloyl-ACP methyl ester carboxylesterase